MKEQPENDLFKWSEEHPQAPRGIPVVEAVPASRTDSDPLDWCPQCDLLGHHCPHHENFVPEVPVAETEPNPETEHRDEFEAANDTLQIVGHSPKRKDEIPLEEFIAGLNETQAKINKREAS